MGSEDHRRLGLASIPLCAALGCSLLAPDDAHFLGGNTGGAGGSGGSAETACAPAPACDEASDGPSTTVTPADVAALSGIVADAPSGTTILLEPGTYPLTAALAFNNPSVTLASSTDNPEEVVLDGGGIAVMIAVRASDITLRGITVRNALGAAILLGAGADTVIEHPRLCNVRVEDGGSPFVEARADLGWVDCGRVEDSALRLTDPGRETLCEQGLVSGLSIAGGRGWVVKNSEFRDFYCSNPVPATQPADCSGNAAIATVFSRGARDTVIENCRYIGVARALAFGYTITDEAPRAYADAPYPGLPVDHYDGIIRNNVVLGHPHCYDTGFELNRARRPEVLHNTIVHADVIGFSAIDRRYPETETFVRNNLVRGPTTFRDSAPQTGEEASVTVDALDAFFVDALGEDFHLLPSASQAIDAGVSSPLSGVDIDGDPHDAGGAPDVGADEAAP